MGVVCRLYLPLAPMQLDSQQQAAVNHTGSNLLILAGAGSGKTSTLAHRIARLLKDTRPENMLVVSFTRKSARELEDRVRGLVDNHTGDAIRGGWFGTFHSACRKILNLNWQHLGFEREPSILDPLDSKRILQACAARERVSAELLPGFHSYLRNSGRNLDDLQLRRRFKIEASPEILDRIFRAYDLRCLQSNRVDLDSLLTLTRDLLEKHPAARADLRNRFRAILVDEFQDTNPLQESILRQLNNGSNLTVVGDDAQSIYEFRAACVDNILNFSTAFRASVQNLDNNYRSTPQIVGLANASIRNNKRQFPKNNQSKVKDGPIPLVHAFPTQTAEADWIVNTIRDHQSSGGRLKDLAILHRSENGIVIIQAGLSRAKIPFVRTGGGDFSEILHVKWVLDFLRLVINPIDSIALENLAQLFPGGGELLGDLFDPFNKWNPTALWNSIGGAAGRRQTGALGMMELNGMVERIRAGFPNGVGIGPAVTQVIKFLRPLMASRNPHPATDMIEDLGVLLATSMAYASFQDFITSISLQQPVNSPEVQEEDRVTLTTVHSAKGLEWDHVFIVSLVGWVFPSKLSIDALGSDEEERRLFYVAVTRAKQHLHLCHFAKSLAATGKEAARAVSSFLTELPPGVCRHVAS